MNGINHDKTIQYTSQQTLERERGRGRQAQIPKRYEFQKNIPRQTSSQHQNVFMNRINSEDNNKISFNGSIAGMDGYNGSPPLMRNNFQERSKNVHMISMTNLAQFKRHSIASLSSYKRVNSSNHIINAYNDTTVFETTAPGTKNYAFEQFQKQQKQEIIQHHQYQRHQSVNGYLNKRRDETFDKEVFHTENKINQDYIYNSNEPDSAIKLFKPVYFQDETNNNEVRESLFSRVSNKNENSEKLGNLKIGYMVNTYSDDDETVKMNYSSSDSDNDDENNYDDNYENSPYFNPIEDNINKKIDHASNEINDYSFEEESSEQMMRIQWKKIIMKNEIYNNNFNIQDSIRNGNNDEIIGSAWLNQLNYTNDYKVEPSADGNNRIKNQNLNLNLNLNLNQKEHSKPGVWTQISLEHRNMHEKMTNNLRNLALFSHNPMASSFERTKTRKHKINQQPKQKQDHYHASLQPQYSSAVGARVNNLWKSACMEHSL
jgi:hypothetical protein